MGKHRKTRRVIAGVSATAAGAAVAGSAVLMPAPAVMAAPLAPEHPADHVRTVADVQPATVTVTPGSTLSGIAARVCGSAAKWPSLFAANRAVIGSNPNLILPGQVLRAACAAVRRTVSPGASHAAHLAHLEHLAYLAALKAAASDPVAAPVHQAAPVQQPAAAPVARVTGVSGGTGPISIAGMSAFEQCVIRKESGGDPHAQNPSSTASGLYQFLDTTWAGYGGYQHAKDAPVSVQKAKFDQVMSEPGGANNWAPYDGC